MKYSTEAIDSLMAAGLCSPMQAAAMAAAAVVAAKLPSDDYRVVDVVAPDGVPTWVMVAAKYDFEPVTGDVSAPLVEAMAPCGVRRPAFDPMAAEFVWAVEAGMPASAESEALAEPPPPEAGKPDTEDEPQA